MTPREKFIAALERKPITGRVPHFELVFYLTMEAFGKIHPSHRNYYHWDQMSASERGLHINEIANIYITIAERFGHSAIFIQPLSFRNSEKAFLEIIQTIREKTGDKYFLMMHGDATFGLPDGKHMLEFSYKIKDEPENLKKEADDMVNKTLEKAEGLKKYKGLDGFALCSDYSFNTGPFFSPHQFSEFVTPYLSKLIKGYKDMGFYTIKHTDGNIMPIIDQLVQCEPDALHSLDPQGGIDIAKIKQMYGDRLCLIGNVHCGFLDTGTDDQVIESCRYALKNGMPGYGYIYSTSNCIYTGMALERYELMLSVWRIEGNYD
jgi:uroporphyrinogen decarboxylase